MDVDRRDYADSVAFPTELTLQPIGIVRSAYKQRHGTPRQPGLVSAKEHAARDAVIELFAEQCAPEALRDLASFSHVWVVSWFHLNGPRKRPMVKPPRGGPKRGVFSTRAPHRPNPLGLSAVAIVSVQGLELRVRGLDLIDGTPVLDLKPYVPDFDGIPGATRGWLDELPR